MGGREDEETGAAEASAGSSPVYGLRIWYRWTLLIAAVGAVSYFTLRSTRQLSAYDFELKPLFVLLALISTFCAYLMMFFIWTRLASVFGLKTSKRVAGRAYFLSFIARYIPGKVGLILVRIEAYAGQPPPGVIMATAFEQVASLAAALIILLAGISFSPVLFPSNLRLLSLVAVVPVFIILMPAVLRRMTSIAYRIFRKQEIEIETGLGTNLAFVGLYMIPSLFHGLSLYFVINALTDLSFAHLLTVTGIYVAAMIAGLFALLVPGGIGIREGALFLVLPALVSNETAVISAVAARLVTVIMELALAGTFAAIVRMQRSRTGG